MEAFPSGTIINFGGFPLRYYHKTYSEVLLIKTPLWSTNWLVLISHLISKQNLVLSFPFPGSFYIWKCFCTSSHHIIYHTTFEIITKSVYCWSSFIEKFYLYFVQATSYTNWNKVINQDTDQILNFHFLHVGKNQKSWKKINRSNLVTT